MSGLIKDFSEVFRNWKKTEELIIFYVGKKFIRFFFSWVGCRHAQIPVRKFSETGTGIPEIGHV